MNRNKACLILGVSSDIGASELKKKYHKLVNLTHPDAAKDHDYPYEVHQINEAYEYLSSHIRTDTTGKEKAEKKKISWNAPVNANAFAEREIYQYCEDREGKNIGFVTIDTGKYIWIPDEDFPLFLKSLYNLSRKIISEDDDAKGISRSEDKGLMADLVYLLAGQFFGAENALSLMKHDPEGKEIYYAAAMLELMPEYTDRYDSKHVPPDQGDALFPAAVHNHRLYVKDKEGNVTGYLTFKDDRLLFGIIPLFERRAVQLRMRVTSGVQNGSMDADLWLKRIPEDKNKTVESISLMIRTRLDADIQNADKLIKS